jgi:hypothetical protein
MIPTEAGLFGVVIGFLLGVAFWQITNIVRDTRWLGQERRRTERRKEER